jgi:SNF2 family DNA or RNA helicase
MLDEEWSPSANDQAIARSAAGGLRGINANVPVNVIKLQCENSIEQWIDELLAAKAAIFNRVVEQDGGRELLAKKITVTDLRRVLRGGSRRAAA